MTREQGADRAGQGRESWPGNLVIREQLVGAGSVRGQYPMRPCLGVLILFGGTIVMQILLYTTHTTDTGCLGWPQCRLCDSRGLHWGCLGVSRVFGNKTIHCRKMKGIIGTIAKIIWSSATSAVGPATVLGVHSAMTLDTDGGPQL